MRTKIEQFSYQHQVSNVFSTNVPHFIDRGFQNRSLLSLAIDVAADFAELITKLSKTCLK